MFKRMNRLTVGLVWMLLAMAAVSAQELQEDPAAGPRPKPLSVSITKTLYLPPEMYGQWSVTGTLVESNTDRFFNPVVHDVWVLERQGDAVVISNPANGASAAIEVDEVQGNKATFHRMVMTGRSKIYFEMPTIAVDGDVLTGYTINKYQVVKDGRVKQSYYARYNLQAQRIGGARVRFGNEAAKPDFEVEEINFR